MPSKLKRPRSHRPFAQRPSTNSKQDQICQTDDDLLLNLQITNDLQKQGTSSNETSPNDFFKRQLILSSYIKKLSKENLELKNKLSITNSKLYSIKNKLSIHKTENEANRRHLMDNLAALSLDQNNAKKQLNDKINKFYINFHEEQQRTFNKLKIKEGKLIKLKSEKDETTFQLENVLNAFQVQTRLLEVARKEAFNAREENKETLQKLNDKLYLTSKQRCTNCEVKQKIQVKLTDDVADLTNKLNLKEQELIERKRINQILAEKLEGKKEELIKQELKAKKELEEANNLKIIYSKKIKEFELKLNKTEEERLKLLKNLENENNRTTSVIRQLIPEPCGLTPPEEINKSPLQNNDIIDDYNKSINNNLI
ncbi:hypothetical protein Mgra_00007402 [Meloidogyne graminicola]|uniref:Uncharacterized protein n=1 Tax=Meloidogyne graminicola TaxID=189291 RepID=A0A8S9ZJ45_9BILA|nr:hypothetical protein Mgra_00007402 [Meloidogyne graminicola]